MLKSDPESTRKPYETPTLKTWGDLRTITAGGGGTMAEGHPVHSPQTKI
ncbi:MAG: hypothetical protein WEE89_19445 [Gemmatimonadota bacterium]